MASEIEFVNFKDFVEGLSEATEFASSDKSVVSNSTNGPRKMPQTTAEKLLAQSVLAGNVAPKFIPNATEAKTGFPYMYDGSLYIAKEDYEGPWDASKFVSVGVGNIAIKMLGLASDYGIESVNDAPTGSVIYCASTVSNLPSSNDYNLLTISRSYNRKSYNVQIAIGVAKPDAIYVRGSSSDGTSWTEWKRMLSADDYDALFNHSNISVKNSNIHLDLNDTSLWEVGGISSSSGNNDDSQTSRLRTKAMFELNFGSNYSIEYKNGMTCPSGFAMYCYDKDQGFLGRVPNNDRQPVDAISSFPTTKYIRFGFTNLVGTQTISAANLANIAVFSGNLEYSDSVSKKNLYKCGCYRFETPIERAALYEPETPRIHDNFILQVEIFGEIDKVYVGMGYLKVQGLWLEVTPTKVFVKGGNADSQKAEYTHGLTLGNKTVVRIWRNDYGNDLHFSIITEGMISYENVYSVQGQFAGKVFVRNSADTEKNLSIIGSYSIKRVSANVWIFGDSYCGCHTVGCWPYHLILSGAKSFFIEEENGIASSNAYTDFINVASKNAPPKLLVWAIGMNDSSDSSGSPPSTWKLVTNKVIWWCLANKVKLALVTIPSISTKDNSAKNAFLKSVEGGDVVVIDAAAAVEQEGTLTWKYYGESNQFIASDLIHPSEYGAKAIFNEVLKKLPEIALE